MSAKDKILPAARVAAGFMLSDLITRTRSPMNNVVSLIRKDELEKAIFEAYEQLDSEVYLDEVYAETAALVIAKNAIIRTIKRKVEELKDNAGVLGFVVTNWGEAYAQTVDEELWSTIYLIDQMI